MSTRSFLVTSARACALTSSLLVVAACGDDHDHVHDTTDAAVAVDAVTVDAATTQAVSLQFAARVGGTAFVCGQSYPGVGTTAASYVGADFRFFVSSVALVPVGGGAPVPVTLTVNDNQSAEGVALLDFEDATSACQTGTAATYTTLTGTVPVGSYDGVTFDLGIPDAQNHLDPTGELAPYNASGMLWAWQSGHKFVKIDGVVGGAGFNLHVGSTGCPGTNPQEPPTGPCVNPNRAAITLTGVGPTSTIVADIAPVLAGVDVAVNTAMTAPGCMSFPGDPECETIFPKLALPYGAMPAAAQALFQVE
ncbi:MAG: metallo-mystery pair system four-Cys motif protein [Myxococcales bacterium]|nr:metallo-mystery pair system four-Cys motif protein [Myxococcales bacterium]